MEHAVAVRRFQLRNTARNSPALINSHLKKKQNKEKGNLNVPNRRTVTFKIIVFKKADERFAPFIVTVVTVYTS